MKKICFPEAFDSFLFYIANHPFVETGKQFQLSARTVDDILHNGAGKALEKLKAAHYHKI